MMNKNIQLINIKLVAIILIILFNQNLKSQEICSKALPFCTGTVYNDTTVYGNVSSGGGMNFGCLPNASQLYYYKAQAQNSGSVTLQVSGTIDMNLICWGDIDFTYSLCSYQNTVTACSSTTNTTESITFNITQGKYYIFCITSATNTGSPFTFNQTAGNGVLCFNACSKTFSTGSICYVTSNNNLNNEIYFNNETNSFKLGTIIYRQNSSSLWDSIGYVPNNQADKFIDLASNTNQQSYQYKIGYLDSCNNKQPLSNQHKTILLQSSLGTGSQINLSWNQYSGLSQPPASYYIYRGTTSSNMQLINTVSNTTTAYTDLTPPAGVNLYKIAIKTPTICTSNALTSDTLIYSNYRSSQDVGVFEYNTDYKIEVFPIPASNEINIKTSEGIKTISVIDITGKEISVKKSKSSTEKIELKGFTSGIYFIKIIIDEKIYYKKFVVQSDL